MKKTFAFLTLLCSHSVLFAQWTTSGNNILNTNSGYVGIGSTPAATLSKLTVFDSANLPSTGQSLGVLTVANKYAGINSNVALFESLNPAANAQAAFYAPAQNSFGIQAQRYNTGGTANLVFNVQGGYVGIGLASPGYPLDVNGTANIRGTVNAAGLISNISDPNIGGYLTLLNPDKTANGTASSWRIFNMTGSYGNSLQFWAYDNLGCVSGGMCENRFTIMDNGNVGIGTMTPQSLLAVAGNITAQQIQVTQTGWPDFVFEGTYKPMPLSEIADFVSRNKHLPDMPSASQVAREGLDVGAVEKLQTQKIEELTLYAIDADKRIRRQDSTIALLQQEVGLLKKMVSKP